MMRNNIMDSGENNMHLSDYDVVLVRPSIAENVGLTARSMKAFGFKSLVLTSPGFDWNPGSPAYKTACGSADILSGARVVDSLENAVAHSHRVIGFSRRKHDFDRPHIDLVSWAEEFKRHEASKHISLVFGPEDFGLSNEDKHHCDLLVNIPLQEKTMSLNLAQAVTVVLYELSRHCSDLPGSTTSPELFADHADIQRVVARLTQLLDDTSFFKQGRRERQIETLRNMVQRVQLTALEYDVVMGVLTALQKDHDCSG